MLADGTIDSAVFGRMAVAGLSIEEIEDEVLKLVRAGGDEKTTVNVRLVTANSACITSGRSELARLLSSRWAGNCLGRNPGGRCGIWDGRRDAISFLSRPTEPDGCRIVLPICYRHIAQIGDTSTNYQLKPGDRIYVATRTLCEELAFWETNE